MSAIINRTKGEMSGKAMKSNNLIQILFLIFQIF